MSTVRIIDLSGVAEPLRARTGQLIASGTVVPLSDVSRVIAGSDTTWGTAGRRVRQAPADLKSVWEGGQPFPTR